MLSNTPGQKLNKFVPDYVIFDLETTGISCKSDEVIEISAIKVIKHEVVDEFTTLVNPMRPIPYYASQVNGIYDDMVKNSPVFEDALKNFLDFAGDLILVGHNIHSFDMKFIMRDARKFWNKTVANDYIDTLSLARQCLPELSNYKLVDLAKHYGISSEGAHRALNDCRMNQKVYECLANESAKPTPKDAKICPNCGQILKKRNGRFGEFFGCSGYPMCKFTMNI